MFCKYCGSKLIEGAAFCQECGKATYEQPAANEAPVYRQPVYPVPPVPHQCTYTVSARPAVTCSAPLQEETLEKLRKQTLTLGILGISLSILGLPGLVLSIIAAAKASRYKKLTGKVDGKVLTGYRLSRAGRAIGIVMTVALYFLIEALQQGMTFDFDSVIPDELPGYNEF